MTQYMISKQMQNIQNLQDTSLKSKNYHMSFTPVLMDNRCFILEKTCKINV